MSESNLKLTVLKQSNQLLYIHTILRNVETSREDFIFAADRLSRLLIEEGLNLLPMKNCEVTTPTGVVFHGKKPIEHLCCCSIMRSGNIMMDAVRQVCEGIRIAVILIQRDEETAIPKKIYKKYPLDIATRRVLLVDPMLATGGSACMAIQDLIDSGVLEDHIVFLNLIAAPEGINKLHKDFPKVHIVTSMIDECLNEQKYILPGVGDFGDRYFGTTD